MEVTLQYFDGCPNRDLLERRVVEVLEGRPDMVVVRQRIETPEDAARLGFHGSPTVLVDGVDPFAEEHAPVGLACRIYRTPDGLAGSPTVEQLRSVIAGAVTATTRDGSLAGPLDAVPIACTLTPEAGQDQVESWRAFDDEYALHAERSDTTIVVHYTRTDDSVQRLNALVATESACCSFVDWEIDDRNAGLRLVVTGSAEQLAALRIG